MKKTIITGIAALFCSAALAQQAGVPEQSNEPVSESKYGDDMSFFDNIDEYAVYTSKAEIAAEQFLNEIGMNIGLNKSDKGDIYIARGFANFSVDASNKQFEIDRSLTFEAAMADAKKAIANYFGQEVSKKLQSVLEMNNPTAEPMSNTSQNKGANPDVFDKLVNLANAKLDEELAKSNKGGAASEETIKKVLNSSSMATAIERVSAQQVGGLITLKVFEEKDGISVIACYSDLSIELAAIINGNTANIKRSDVKGEPIIPAINKMEIGELYTCQGVQTKPDEEGKWVLLSYGISQTPYTDNNSLQLAQSAAETKAVGQIRSFAGELVVTSSINNEARSTVNFQDTINQPINQIEQANRVAISTEASKLNISGIVPIKKWQYKDPRSNTLVCGTVCMWSIDSAVDANKQRKKVENKTKNNGGFDGRTNPDSNPPIDKTGLTDPTGHSTTSPTSLIPR